MFYFFLDCHYFLNFQLFLHFHVICAAIFFKHFFFCWNNFYYGSICFCFISLFSSLFRFESTYLFYAHLSFLSFAIYICCFLPHFSLTHVKKFLVYLVCFHVYVFPVSYSSKLFLCFPPNFSLFHSLSAVFKNLLQNGTSLFLTFYLES